MQWYVSEVQDLNAVVGWSLGQASFPPAVWSPMMAVGEELQVFSKPLVLTIAPSPLWRTIKGKWVCAPFSLLVVALDPNLDPQNHLCNITKSHS